MLLTATWLDNTGNTELIETSPTKYSFEYQICVSWQEV